MPSFTLKALISDHSLLFHHVVTCGRGIRAKSVDFEEWFVLQQDRQWQT